MTFLSNIFQVFWYNLLKSSLLCHFSEPNILVSDYSQFSIIRNFRVSAIFDYSRFSITHGNTGPNPSDNQCLTVGWL